MKEKSSVPCGCISRESSVISTPVHKMWSAVKDFDLKKLAPEKVKQTEWVSGNAGEVGANVCVCYTDGSKFVLRVTEVSERSTTVAYELVSSEQEVSYASMQGEISLKPVSDCDCTFI